jgi:hypothetical protein
MSAFLAGLGAALSTGSALSGRRRLERRQETIDKQDREQQLLQMALQREGMDLQRRSADIQERSFAGQELDRSRGFAKDLIAQIGPEGVVDDTAAAAIEAGGLGGRLSALQTQTAPDPVSMQTIQLEGLPQQRTLNATSQERIALDATRAGEAEKTRIRDMQTRAREAIQLPGYSKMNPINQAVVWQQAGFDGAPPDDEALIRGRMQFQADLGLRNAREIEGLRNAGDLEEALARARATGANKPTTGAQQKTFGFYQRMRDANEIMNELEDSGQLSTKDLEILNSSPAPEWINNRLLSSAGQRYAQAARAWAEARLRKESGAAISLGEFKNDRTMGIFQGSDMDDVRNQKKGFRRGTLDSFAVEAGKAYEDYYGSPYQRQGNAVPVQGGARLDNGAKPDPFGIR